MTSTIKHLCSVVAFLGVSTARLECRAAPMLADSFAVGGGDYSIGALVGQTGTPETGSYAAAWSGTGTGANFGEPQITTSGLSYMDANGNTLNVGGGAVRMQRTESGSFSKGAQVEPNGTPPNGDSVYFSGIMDLGGASNGWFGIEIGHPSNPTAKDVIGIGVNSSGNAEIRRDGTVSATSGGTFDVSGPIFLVGRIQDDGGGPGQDRVYLYLNPLLPVEPGSANLTVNVGPSGWFPSDSLRLLQFRALMNLGGAPTFFDEFRIGSTWSDVTPFTAAPIPEPPAVWLSVIGGIGVLALMRRRSAATSL